MKFRQETAGDDGWSDWIHPLAGYKMACCDCGLVHNIEFRIDDMNQLNFRVSRNVRSTAAMRRNKTGKPVTKPNKITMTQARRAVNAVLSKADRLSDALE